MSNVYVIDNTAGTLTFTIQPGELNGPGGVARNSDLRLYGEGALQWGEGVDENILRLAENFAAPAKEAGDYNPYTQANDYNPATDPILPRSEQDIYPGQGITVPIDGQLWYNSSIQKMYYYDACFDLTTFGYPGYTGRWLHVASGFGSDEPPTNPDPGDLWFNLLYDEGCIHTPQLMVFSPTHPDANTDGWVHVAEDFVRQCGDFMTGRLTMYDMIDMSNNRILNLADPNVASDALNLGFADTRYVNVIGDFMTGNLDMTGNRVRNVGSPVDSGDALNLGFADSRFINVTGDAMTGWLSLRETIPANDWYAVPVIMLNDAVGDLEDEINDVRGDLTTYINGIRTDLINRINQKRFYYGMTRVSRYGSGNTTLLSFQLQCWVNHYNSTYGASYTANQWAWVVIPNMERVLISNGNPSYEPAGNIGDYSWVRYYSEYTARTNATITVELGSHGISSTVDPGTERRYSTRGQSLHRIHILGLPPPIRNNYGLPYNGGAPC